jgi:hypothetical protein
VIDSVIDTSGLSSAREKVETMLVQISDTQKKAAWSHELVEDFTRNIKYLDLAKKNLGATLTGFKRFVMLVTALEQLRQLAIVRDYRQVCLAPEWALRNFRGIFQEFHVEFR